MRIPSTPILFACLAFPADCGDDDAADGDGGGTADDSGSASAPTVGSMSESIDDGHANDKRSCGPWRQDAPKSEGQAEESPEDGCTHSGRIRAIGQCESGKNDQHNAGRNCADAIDNKRFSPVRRPFKTGDLCERLRRLSA